MALATVEDLEAVAGPVADEARAERLLEMASAVVERWCRRSFARTSDPVTVEVCDGTFRLPGGPWGSITSITGPAPATTTYAEAGYTLKADGTLKRVYGSWMCGTYTVVGPHGYDPIPDDVIAVVCAVVGRATASDIGVGNESLGTYAVGFRAGAGAGVVLTEDDKALLRPYRRAVTSVPMVRA